MTKKAKTRTEEQGFALTSNCPYHFGYLNQRPKGEEIPEECITCEKSMDCMLSKLESSSSKPAKKLKIPTIKQTQESVGERAEETLKKDYEITPTQKSKTEPASAESSQDQFVVENLGMLYASWSNTVRVHKEILTSWGKKTKEVEIENADGKKVQCKVQPMQDSSKGSIQIPDKVQRDLQIVKGESVKVKPVIKS